MFTNLLMCMYHIKEEFYNIYRNNLIIIPTVLLLLVLSYVNVWNMKWNNFIELIFILNAQRRIETNRLKKQLKTRLRNNNLKIDLKVFPRVLLISRAGKFCIDVSTESWKWLTISGFMLLGIGLVPDVHMNVQKI